MQLMEETAVERLNMISSSEKSSNENNLLNAASINEKLIIMIYMTQKPI